MTYSYYSNRVAGFGILAASLALAIGCGEPAKVAPPTAAAEKPADEKAAGVESQLVSLSAEDRAAVLAQKVCPVSEEALGSMGDPIKVTVNGKSLFICCEGCEKDVKDKFDEYYAKYGPKTEAKPKM